MTTQTTIEPCEFCGDPAVEELELTPAVEETRGEGNSRAKVVAKPAVMVCACATHAEAIRGGRGWQERRNLSRRLTREAKERLRRDQLDLFGDAA